jgi:hypothetical protein
MEDGELLDLKSEENNDLPWVIAREDYESKNFLEQRVKYFKI